MKRGFVHGFTLLAALVVSPAISQSYPSKPVRIIVAFTPGGANDLIGRMLGQKLTENFGQTVIVDNRSGAGGNIGTDIVAKSAPDGYTLLLGSTGPHTINPHLYAKMPYDTLKDFTPVSLVASSSALLVLHPSIPANSVPQLLALGKTRGSRLNYASSGNGSSGHLAGELFKTMTGIQMTHIPYKGNGVAFTDLIAGQVDVMFANKPGSLPFVKMGKLKAIAITSRKRDPSMTDLPTVAEAVPGFEASTWWGVLGPAGLPKDIVEKLNAAIVKIVAAPEVKERLIALGADPISTTPEEFMNLIRAELPKYGKIVHVAGMKPE
jgi:tripartite-type tricarboxylate transporter receptor subunit TctC